MAQLDAQSIINFIGSAPKKTFVKVYVKGKNLDSLTYPEGVDAFVESRTGILFGDWKEVKPFLDEHAKILTQSELKMKLEILLFRFWIQRTSMHALNQALSSAIRY